MQTLLFLIASFVMAAGSQLTNDAFLADALTLAWVVFTVCALAALADEMLGDTIAPVVDIEDEDDGDYIQFSNELVLDPMPIKTLSGLGGCYEETEWLELPEAIHTANRDNECDFGHPDAYAANPDHQRVMFHDGVIGFVRRKHYTRPTDAVVDVEYEDGFKARMYIDREFVEHANYMHLYWNIEDFMTSVFPGRAGMMWNAFMDGANVSTSEV